MVKLFSGYLSSQMNVTEDNLAAFVDATKDVSLEALRRSVEQFSTGKVERNNAFPPNSAEVAENARLWQHALDGLKVEPVTLHNGLLNVDYGRGSIDMRGLTNAEQDAVMALSGLAPDGQSMAGMSLEGIKQAITQNDRMAVDGTKSFSMPRLGRMS